MIRSAINKWAFILFVFLIHQNSLLSQHTESSKFIAGNGDLFGTRNFIENKGQFENPVDKTEPVLFYYEHRGERFHFTKKGIIYELIYVSPLEEHEKEELEEKGLDDLSRAERHYVSATWQNASSEVKVESSEKQSHYFTYGTAELNSSTFKKITYYNVYPKIDVEYLLPADKETGIKYNVLIHPGADPSQVKLAYSGEIKKMKIDEQGNIVVKTPLQDIKEYAPQSYANKEKILSNFVLTDRVLSFDFPQGLDPEKEIVIDPFISAITTLASNNYGYDVDYNFANEVYVYGGNATTTAGRCKVAKYSNTGVLLWTFSGIVTTPAWNTGSSWSSNFKVNKGNGKTYVSRNNGLPNLIRLDANGNYDNFISFGSTAVGEVWNMDLICNGDLLVFGGASTSGEIVSTTTGSISLVTTFSPNITGCCQDVVSYAIDPMGDMFVYFLGHTQLSYKIGKLAQSFTTSIWHAPSGFNVLSYLANKNLYVGASAGPAVAFNALAVNMNYLFYYDGLNVAAFNKTNGALVSSTLCTGLTGRVQGGIAVDDCNNVYVGGNGDIRCFSFNGTNFSTLTPISLGSTLTNQYVYDISLNHFNNTLFVSGSGFCGSYSAVHTTTCQLQQVATPCSFGQSTITAASTSITCANLGSATVTANGGLGPFTYTWLPPVNQTGSVVTGLSPGTYSVIVTDIGANFTYTSMAVFMPLVPLSGNISSSGSVPCFGATTATASVVNLAGGSGNQSYLWSNGLSTQTTAVASGMGAGNWTVTVVDALTGCQLVQPFLIFEPLPVSAFITANTTTACTSDVINLNGIVSGGVPGYNYTWVNGPTSASFAVSETTAGAHTYTLNSADQNTCGATSFITVTFVPHPSLSVSSVSVCPLHFGTLTATGATNYTWSTNTNGAVLSLNPSSSTIYTVTGEALACTSTATAGINIYPSPTPFISNNSPVCEHTILQLTGGGGVGYSWTGPASYASTLSGPNLANANINMAGIYNLTVTSVNGCTASATTNVTVNLVPVVTANAATVCTSQTLNLSASAVPSGNFSWAGPNAFSSNLQNPVLNNPVLGADGNYVVLVTSVNGCTGSAVANAKVISPPALSHAFNSESLCAQALNGSPNSITLTAQGANTYTLLTSSHVVNNSPTSPFYLNTTPPFQTVPTVGSATIVGSNGVCTSTQGVTFSIVPNPIIAVSNPSPEICAGESYTYTSSGATSYTWGLNTPGITTMNNGGVAVANPTISSVFSVVGSSIGCNSALVTTTLTVHPIPTLTVTPKSSTICIGTSIVLKVNGTGSTYSWSPGTGLNFMVGTSVTAKPLVNQIYTITASAFNCTNAITAQVFLLPLPKPIAVVADPTVCVNELIKMVGYGGVQYHWRGPGNFLMAGPTPTFNANVTGFSGTYTLSVTDDKGCIDSTYVQVLVNPLPNASLESKLLAGCVPFCPEFTVASSFGTGAVSSTWTVGQRKFIGPVFSTCFYEGGEYLLSGILTDTLTNCQNTSSLKVLAYNRPKADFIWLPETPTEGLDDVLFTNTSSGDWVKQFSWYFGDSQNGKSTKENPEYTFNDAGVYPVTLIVKSAAGCIDTITKSIKVIEDFAVYVPNAFTPNSDDINDRLVPVMRGAKAFHFEIYDRWGEKIFESITLENTWDGTYKGKPCKEEVYSYSLVVTAQTGESKRYMGHVTLYR